MRMVTKISGAPTQLRGTSRTWNWPQRGQKSVSASNYLCVRWFFFLIKTEDNTFTSKARVRALSRSAPSVITGQSLISFSSSVLPHESFRRMASSPASSNYLLRKKSCKLVFVDCSSRTWNEEQFYCSSSSGQLRWPHSLSMILASGPTRHNHSNTGDKYSPKCCTQMLWNGPIWFHLCKFHFRILYLARRALSLSSWPL